MLLSSPPRETVCTNKYRVSNIERVDLRGGSFLVDVGGSDGARTHDILLAKQALSQLSYTPSDYIIIDYFTIVK